MSRPPEQRNVLSPRGWVRFYQRLWRGLWFFWTAIFLTLVLGIGITWLTTKSFDISGTPLEWIPVHFPLVFAIGGLLVALTVVIGYLGRPAASPARALPTLEDRRKLMHLLSN